MVHSTKKIGMMFTTIAWILAFLALALAFSKILQQQSYPNRSVSTLNAADYREIVLQRNRNGQYVFDGQINRQRVTFLVDTGATTTAIPGQLQKELQLEAGTAYSVSTANGVTTAYTTRLEQLAMGDIELLNVKASIIPGMGINEVLLGMNVLKNLELVQRGDQLIIRQYQ